MITLVLIFVKFVHVIFVLFASAFAIEFYVFFESAIFVFCLVFI